MEKNSRTEIKTKRTKYREFLGVYDLRNAYFNEIRKYNKTKKIYDVNPYAEVFRYRDNLYAILTESLDGMGNPWSYLIVGPEKAMLVDTSFGLGDLKGLCDEITGGKELIVVNTHSHYDHAYGNAQFDTVYCHEDEAARLETKNNSHIWDYLFDENGNGIWADFDKNDLIEYKHYNIVGVPNHYTWDLGDGYEIELISLPGHTEGHAVYLDKHNHTLFGGDQTCVGGPISLMGPEWVVKMRDALKGIVDRIDEIEGVFPGHAFVDMDPQVLVDMYNTCCRACEDLENPDEVEERMGFDGTMWTFHKERYEHFGFIQWRTK